jgi:hypothetical protein
MPYWIIINISSPITHPIWFLDIIDGVVQILFMSIMEHLHVVCAIECVMASFLKPKLLKLESKIVNITKALPFGTQCSLVPFLDSLALVLALKLLEVSLSLIYNSHFSTLLQFIILN